MSNKFLLFLILLFQLNCTPKKVASHLELDNSELINLLSQLDPNLTTGTNYHFNNDTTTRRPAALARGLACRRC
jgi:hypothetical protein